ncbi:RDD family protein [Streptomyces sp. NBC_00140]|uniref:RDD family protein n=1 Tax=Streptomyces sp. NBC_00140 TaxID=2975664 RepID=UPI002259BF38|nr:RDD family protein [Streptomyces sp. NBC_00140]MCX5333750.1 RDD family protein [Streptomyces sp. NBC_00140]
MSAPTPAPGDDRPREGYYPDPSIPGYVRYWNGAAWVPGTSRPAPSDGEAPAPPAPSSVEETGPHFFDEDPQPAPNPSDAQHGSRPEPASAWGADRSRQSGFGGDQDRRVSWGAAAGTDPRVPSDTTSGDGTATIPPAESDSAASGNTFVFRRPTPGAAAPSGPGTTPQSGSGSGASGGPAFGGPGTGGPGAAGSSGPSASGAGVSGGPAFSGPGTGGSGAAGSHGPSASGPGASGGPAFGAAGSSGAATPGVPAPGGPVADEGTMTFRALSPRTAQQGGAQGGGTGGARSDGAAAGGFGAQPAATPGFRAGKAAAERAASAQAGVQGAVGQAAPAGPSGPQQAAPQTPPASVPQQSTPMASGAGGGQSSWAQQVHRLATPGEDEPVTPWKPPVEDVFQAAARRQASARPAGLGKRLTARLLDTVVLVGVTAAAAVPLGTRALDHVNEKIDAAKLSGETVTVWLLDGTTSAYLGIVLAVLLVFGVLYEALPTAKWGRTLGKKLLGLEVRDIEGGEPPTFGAALRRWLVYSVPGLLAIGVVGVVWGLFDRPWRQCWHDKAAHTFVAG